MFQDGFFHVTCRLDFTCYIEDRAFRCRFDLKVTCYVLGQILVYILRLRLDFQLHVTLQVSIYMLLCRLNITCYVVGQIFHATLQVKLYMLRCRLDFTCYIVGWILHVTDFHWDRSYSSNDLSCNGVVNTHGMYGDYWCDSPFSLIDVTMKAMKNATLDKEVDFMLWTG